MAWETNVISGTPASWLEVEYTEAEQVTDPAKQRWAKDPTEPEYWFDGATHWRFPGQFSTAILFSNFSWTPQAIPDTAVPQHFRVRFEKFMLGGAFSSNDIRDGGLVPTYPSGVDGNTPKPDDKDYAENARWLKGQVQPYTYRVLRGVEESNRLTNEQLRMPGFGFLFYMKTGSGKFEAVNGTGLGIANPTMEVEYIIEVP